MKEKKPEKIIAAITAALSLYLEEQIKAPPFIILPGELRSAPSLWRFIGRKEVMDSRTLVQMNCMKW
ncbi:MAG: hypothetical protein RDV48_09910 [Candidatus Eremiobacteraeota bacterium]|nr:hypothetical protein [Candidatus Eremiobacteraeota bacterium]